MLNLGYHESYPLEGFLACCAAGFGRFAASREPGERQC